METDEYIEMKPIISSGYEKMEPVNQCDYVEMKSVILSAVIPNLIIDSEKKDRMV